MYKLANSKIPNYGLNIARVEGNHCLEIYVCIFFLGCDAIRLFIALSFVDSSTAYSCSIFGERPGTPGSTINYPDLDPAGTF